MSEECLPAPGGARRSGGTEGTTPSRRDFLRTGAAAAGALALPAMAWADGALPSRRKVLHMIGHSHIDAAWLWPWRDGADTALNTFRSVLNRMKETPGFRYSHSSMAHYRWVQRADPGMFEEVRQRVREGRWEVVGGWPVEPDCNIPSTESFVRDALYGKAYARAALGVDVSIGFNPDSFGHAFGLPTILSRTGYRYYAFMRPGEGDHVGLPLLFWWEGPDGSRVLTLRIYQNYDAPLDALPKMVGHLFAPGFDHGAFFMGVGDHGGAVTRGQIARVLKMREDPALPELRWSTLREFFKAAEASPAFAALPVVRWELQHTARGCYSAYGKGKKDNRRSERLLTQSETILSAGHLCGRPYPGPEFAEAWWKVLFCQFHDMMAGTAIESVYEDVRDSLGWACETAQSFKVETLEAMAKRVDTSAVAGSAVFLFNPLPWRRRALVQIHSLEDPDKKGDPFAYLLAKDGSRIPIQWRYYTDSAANFPLFAAWVELPACGYRVFEVKKASSGTAPAVSPAAFPEAFTLSDREFGLSSLRAPDGTELLSAPIGLVVIEDRSDTWGHRIDRFRNVIGRPQFLSSMVMEEGPIIRVTRRRARWRDSEIVMDVVRHAGVDGVELRFVIDWHERHEMLKLEIPIALSNPQLHAKVPGAVIRRSTNGDEEPYQDWIAIQGKAGGGEYTLGLLNDSTYSYDCQDGLLRTVLIRSAHFANHIPAKVPPNDATAWQDQGRQERAFRIVSGRGPWTALDLDCRAEEFQTPAEYVFDAGHAGSEPWEKSFFEVSPPSVAVLAIKKAERGEGTVVRVQERSGSSCRATLALPILRLIHRFAVGPFEIKTLLVESAGRVREISALEVA